VAARVVIIGGDAGGMTAATQARRLDPSLDIVAFERGSWTSYSACGIPYLVAGDVEELDDLVARTPDQHRDQSHIDVRLQHEVVGLDVDAGRVEVRDLARDRTYTFSFDCAVVATGARPIRPDLPGIQLPFVHGLQTLDDAANLLTDARRAQCRNAVVVGGGYIGLELAEAFVARGARVTVVESSDQLLRTLDADMAEPIAKGMRDAGIDVRLGVYAHGFSEGEVHTTEGSIAADVVVLGLGVEPESTLAGAAGLELGVKDAVVVDRRQRTSAENVWAAGDCAQSIHLVSGQPVHIALGTVANRHGRVAGTNIGGGYATFPGVLGTAVTRVCDVEIGRTGLSEREAADAGFVTVAAVVESTTTAGYLSTPGTMRTKLVVERGTGRVLGGQIVGGRGAAKRVDTIAVAITAGMDAPQLIDVDLGYAPPFGPLWDPVAVAARQLLPQI
jgi:NADPH-dependent 2,4-dienoyl-CoA reductase/sulfur reductase-like enzyme